MNFKSFCSETANAAKYVGVCSGLEATQTALANQIGNAVLSATGHNAVAISKAMFTGGIGGLLTGSVVGGLAACGLFKKTGNKPSILAPLEVGCIVGLPILSSMLGYAIQQAATDAATISIGEPAAMSAVGNAIFVGGMWLLAGSCLAISRCIKAATKKPEVVFESSDLDRLESQCDNQDDIIVPVEDDLIPRAYSQI